MRSDSNLSDDLVATIQSATSRVWLQVPWWDPRGSQPAQRLLETCIDRHRNGCEVRVITRNEASNARAIEELERAGVPVRCQRYLHQKELLADDRVFTFSANFTSFDLERNINAGYMNGDLTSVEGAKSAFENLWETNPATALAGDESWLAIEKIVPSDLRAFFGHQRLNPLQAKALPVVLTHPGHVLVVAPTGSGKTELGVAAIVRAIIRERRRAVYLTPARALSRERMLQFQRWNALGVRTTLLSGEELVDDRAARSADLWVATTEKFESMCRRSTMAQAVADIGVVVVDEIHLVGDRERGPVLEALLARLRLLTAQTRILGLSATVENGEEVAKWLNAELVTSEWRPVVLTRQIIPLRPHRNVRDLEEAKNEAIEEIVQETRRGDGQCLIFCGSKPKVRSTAAFLVGAEHLQREEARLATAALERQVGMHYRGLAPDHLKRVEARFRVGALPTLVATSGLAQGVNLPARVVIIRDTVLGQSPLSSGDALQMFGRAGRHGQESEGHGIILVPADEADDWRHRLLSGHRVRSQILGRIADHVLAEVLLRRITSIDEAKRWFAETLAAHQGAQGVDEIDEAMTSLVEGGFLETDIDGALECTEYGRITSRFLVEVSSATSIVDALRSLPAPAERRDVEDTVLRAVCSGASGLANSYVPERAEPELDYLLRESGFSQDFKHERPGVRKAILAAGLALREPHRLDQSKPVGPFNVVEIRDLVAELPRYLAWAGAIGPCAIRSWQSPVAADLAARIEWRDCRPVQGSGRLLRFLSQLVPADERRIEVPKLYRLALRKEKYRPEDFTERPRIAELHEDAWERLCRDRVGVSIESVGAAAEVDDASTLEIVLTRESGDDLTIQAEVNTGHDAVVATTEHWGGSKLTCPTPAGDGQLAVDVLAFGRADWSWCGGRWSVDSAHLDPLARVRNSIDHLATGAIGDRRTIAARIRGGQRRRRRAAIEILNSHATQLTQVARSIVGRTDSSIEEQWEQIRTTLNAILARSEGHEIRPPANVLKDGCANPSEYGLVVACLLRALGHEVGIAETSEGTIIALVEIESTWMALCAPVLLGAGRIHPLVPSKTLSVTSLPYGPTRRRIAPRPKYSFLTAFASTQVSSTEVQSHSRDA